jgi:hypothetical protein
MTLDEQLAEAQRERARLQAIVAVLERGVPRPGGASAGPYRDTAAEAAASRDEQERELARTEGEVAWLAERAARLRVAWDSVADVRPPLLSRLLGWTVVAAAAALGVAIVGVAVGAAVHRQTGSTSMEMWAEIAEQERHVTFVSQGPAQRCQHFADAVLRNLGETGRGPWRYAIDVRSGCFGTEVTVFERARACVVHTLCSRAPKITCTAPGGESRPNQLEAAAHWLRAACNLSAHGTSL